jgi:hypothetical protein
VQQRLLLRNFLRIEERVVVAVRLTFGSFGRARFRTGCTVDLRGFRRHWRLALFRFLERQLRSQGPAIVKLDAAEPAVVEVTARQALQQVQKAPVHRVDAIRSLQPLQFRGAALRAAALPAEMVHEPPRHQFFILAVAAFVDRHVPEAFKKRPMDPLELPATNATFVHCHPFYRELQRQTTSRHNEKIAISTRKL